ncbi:glycoside hydrolase family 27 protein [Cellulomonas marina]|uniref:Alpha-galactosidase n=1 Tax=Cellulomonas marina TaxID=988821 RepID=A0A1I0XI62_9CELL|nr:glycoside hydrolase family 27 protein [Cellulomonas marina]GIG30071.1 alpha-galactosidase [Cellulomonas marina]SFB00701.1 Alpha galactosidase A [Cellulomonas marina]
MTGTTGVAATPPMGWNSWDCYGTTVTEDEVLANARVMAERLLPVGWDTVVVDIAWYDPTARAHGYNEGAPVVLDAYGRQLPAPGRFPSAAGGCGFGPLADAVHALGLRFGVHVMRGVPRRAVELDLPVLGTSWTARDVADPDHVCPWNPDNLGLDHDHPGAQAWYDAQVAQLAGWGVDLLKVDDMLAPYHAREIEAYARAVERSGRPIVLSLSPGTHVSTRHVEHLRANAHMWRISDDLWDRWEDVHAQLARLARWAPFQRPGGWADADMLPLGRIGLRAERGEPRDSRLTPHEQRTLLTVWTMARSPLMVGGDLPSTDPATLDLLATPAIGEVLRGSTDGAELVREPLGTGPDAGELVVWGARAAGGERRYAALVWTGEAARTCAVAVASVVGTADVGRPWGATDLWDPAGPVPLGDELVAEVPPHGVRWFALDPA